MSVLRLVLDTNVFSAMMQPNTGPKAIAWLSGQPITCLLAEPDTTSCFWLIKLDDVY